jgi:hypothetical protein
MERARVLQAGNDLRERPVFIFLPGPTTTAAPDVTMSAPRSRRLNSRRGIAFTAGVLLPALARLPRRHGVSLADQEDRAISGHLPFEATHGSGVPSPLRAAVRSTSPAFAGGVLPPRTAIRRMSRSLAARDCRQERRSRNEARPPVRVAPQVAAGYERAMAATWPLYRPPPEGRRSTSTRQAAAASRGSDGVLECR